jgi:L-threonylcarbamoyladenylate synthase
MTNIEILNSGKIMQNNIWDNKNLIKTLQGNGVVVMPTDTIYGIVGKAPEKNVVGRIYDIKRRNPEKPCIILIANTDELKKFGIKLTQNQKDILKELWPGPISVILDHFAFRLPSPKPLRNLLLKTGPLIAPSANPEARLPSKNIEEAKEYFGNSVDLYIDGGEFTSKASKLIKLNDDGSIIVLRE